MQQGRVDTTEERSPRRAASILEPRDPDRVDAAGRLRRSLPLRQTEGFLDSLLSLMSRDLKVPDHTTLSRRNQIVVVVPLTRAHDGPIDLIVDSTGLKILGRGEWNAHKHKTSKKRRDWRKLHIGVDAEGFMVAAELTASSRDETLLHGSSRRMSNHGVFQHWG